MAEIFLSSSQSILKIISLNEDTMAMKQRLDRKLQIVFQVSTIYYQRFIPTLVC